LWLGGYAVMAWCSIAAAQTVYKWTDEHGVIHFADTPPSEAATVEERHLSGPPPAQVRAEPAPEARAEKKDAPAGPARVIVASRKTPRVGPSELHVGGEVRNVGGADAERVVVTVSAVDSQQGNPCLSEEIVVKPPTLHPGDSGTFDADIDSPCLIGQSRVDIAPVWN
jgi:hypothetical protein